MVLKKGLLLLFISISSSYTFSQGPPPMAMPDKANTLLIDSIIKITEHEVFFQNYCTKRVNEFASLHKWPASKTTKILRSIKFEYYNSTIYNSYAEYTTQQLTQLIEALNKLNTTAKSWTKLVLINEMMQNNLDLFVKSIIEGEYVME